jgi:hypothetical protein
LDVVAAKEGEQGVALAGQVVQQPPVGWIDGSACQQPVDRNAEPLGLGGGLGGVQLAAVTSVPCRQGAKQDAAHRMRRLGLAPLGVIQQLATAA